MLTLTPVTQKFVLHWGEMGARWGINRTVAQVHALIYVSPRAVNAEEIAETLSVARSNVSTSLRELQNWGIIKIVHVLGDRRDHFESMKDVWEMFRIILNERKRREIDPTLIMLRECIADLEKTKASEQYTQTQLVELLNFFESMTGWYEQINKMPTGAVIKFVKLGDRAFKLLGASSD